MATEERINNIFIRINIQINNIYFYNKKNIVIMYRHNVF